MAEKTDNVDEKNKTKPSNTESGGSGLTTNSAITNPDAVQDSSDKEEKTRVVVDENGAGYLEVIE